MFTSTRTNSTHEKFHRSFVYRRGGEHRLVIPAELCTTGAWADGG